jgi:hypothetical protein
MPLWAGTEEESLSGGFDTPVFRHPEIQPSMRERHRTTIAYLFLRFTV